MPFHKPLILTVDDDPLLLKVVGVHVRAWGYDFAGVSTEAELHAALNRQSPSVVLLDMHLDDQDGMVAAARIKKRFPEVPVIIITGHGSIDAAVRCMKAGVFDFITKPLDFDRLHIEVANAIEMNRLSRRVRDLESGENLFQLHGLVGASDAMQRVYELLQCVAPIDATVLILGETGTGKELVARAIHQASRRARGPFVAVNAAAIPHELIESALFGHEKGSFTGAQSAHAGYCEQADGGTLFLDEIADMDYKVQAKLLRFLQDHVVQRVGGRSGRAVDVRVVAATNADPKTQIAEKKLREDLYYRLNVVTVNLPPLRERTGDVPLLAYHLLDRAAKRHGRPMNRIDSEALRRLEAYAWPGNVRELENRLEQIVATNSGESLTMSMLPMDLQPPAAPMLAAPAAPLPMTLPTPVMTPSPVGDPLGERMMGLPLGDSSRMLTPIGVGDSSRALLPLGSALVGAANPGQTPQGNSIEGMERRLIIEELRRCDGAVPTACKNLGISKSTLYRKIKKYGLALVPAVREVS